MSLGQRLPSAEQIAEDYRYYGPMTARDASGLAMAYGYDTVEKLAADIPEEGRVLDAGAGLSDPGNTIASLRPDISWTNLDIRYAPGATDDTEREKLARLYAEAPSNVSYISGDIFNPPTELIDSRFDRILSYVMLVHAFKRGGDASIQAMKNLLSMGAQGGTIAVGPRADAFGLCDRLDCYREEIPETEAEIGSLALHFTTVLRFNYHSDYADLRWH